MKLYLIHKKLNKLFENIYIPRLSLKDKHPIAGIVLNKSITYSRDIMIKAINYGMILRIKYKGVGDESSGNWRYIYPMTLGYSKNGKPLLRAWHLKGFSLSAGNDAEKIWRLFRTDRILEMKFEGMFFRIEPEGYKRQDSVMGNIIKSADINQIIKNQKDLLKDKVIVDSDKYNITKDKNNVDVKVQDTNTFIDLNNPFTNLYLNKNKNYPETIKLLFVKNKANNEIYCLFGVIADKKATINIKNTSGAMVAQTEVFISILGNQIKKYKKIGNMDKIKLYLPIID